MRQMANDFATNGEQLIEKMRQMANENKTSATNGEWIQEEVRQMANDFATNDECS
jgi:hypothetical protein